MYQQYLSDELKLVEFYSFPRSSVSAIISISSSVVIEWCILLHSSIHKRPPKPPLIPDSGFLVKRWGLSVFHEDKHILQMSEICNFQEQMTPD